MTKFVSNKTGNKKRRILTAGAGMVALTAVEGLACGNPVAPRHDMPHEIDPDTVAEPVDSAAPSADPMTEPAVAPSASAGVSDAVMATPSEAAGADNGDP